MSCSTPGAAHSSMGSYFKDVNPQEAKYGDCIIKLELCAFALKGEHNVYSLVPNIAVCMYIYIDTKFSYDNNVYFLYSVNIGN